MTGLKTKPPFTVSLTIAALLLSMSSVAEDALQRSITLSEKNNQQEQQTQQRIDRLSQETEEMLQRYQSLGRELDSLTAYNDQLQRLTRSQEDDKALIQQQIQDIQLTRQEITPLMLRMIDRLETTLADDMPFLVRERTQRVALLRDLMDRADISLAEKYRRILEAYRIELDYGRTLEAYRDEIEINGQLRTVNFLRLGRIGLYYQTLGRREAAYWNADDRAWVSMDATAGLSLKRALRVARQQAAPELIELPVKAAASP